MLCRGLLSEVLKGGSGVLPWSAYYTGRREGNGERKTKRHVTKVDDALFGNAPEGHLLILVAQYYTVVS